MFTSMTAAQLRRYCLVGTLLQPLTPAVAFKHLGGDNHAIDQRVVEMAVTHANDYAQLTRIAQEAISQVQTNGMPANAARSMAMRPLTDPSGPLTTLGAMVKKAPVLKPLVYSITLTNEEALAGLLLMIETFGRTPSEAMALTDFINTNPLARAMVNEDEGLSIAATWRTFHQGELSVLTGLVQQAVQLDNRRGPRFAVDEMDLLMATVPDDVRAFIDRSQAARVTFNLDGDDVISTMWTLRDLTLKLKS